MSKPTPKDTPIAIIPDPRNARKHGERNQATIRASLKNNKNWQNIVIDEGDFILFAIKKRTYLKTGVRKLLALAKRIQREINP